MELFIVAQKKGGLIKNYSSSGFSFLRTESHHKKLPGGKFFSIYYSIDEFSLEFLMFIITAILRARPSPTVTPSDTRHAKQIRQCPAAASRSSRKWSVMYNIRKTFERFVRLLLCYSVACSTKLCPIQYVGIAILPSNRYAMNVYG